MYGKCRLNCNGHLQTLYDVTEYRRKMNNQLRHMRILSVRCYEDDIGAHPECLTLLNNFT